MRFSSTTSYPVTTWYTRLEVYGERAAYLLTSGGPDYATSTVMYYLYETAFRTYQYGYADAMGVILAIIIALFSALQFKVMNGGTTE